MHSQVIAVFERLRSAGVVGDATLVGCSDGEIAGLETQLGSPLPESYRTYLRVAGKGAGEFLAASEARLQDLGEIKQGIDEMEGSWRPKQHDFVFMMHQGYEFTFFELSDDPDPPIWQYLEGHSGPELAWPSFSAFLESMASEHIAEAS
jgi:hypothetical protein